MEIEKQEFEEQHLEFLEKTLEMLEQLHGVRHEDGTTTKKAIESWEDRFQAIEGHLNKMGVICT